MTAATKPAWLRRVLARERPALWLVALPGLVWWQIAILVFLAARRSGPSPTTVVMLATAFCLLAALAAYAFLRGLCAFGSPADARWRALVLVVDGSPALALLLVLAS